MPIRQENGSMNTAIVPHDLTILRVKPDQAVILAGVEQAISNYQLRHGVNERICVPDEFPTLRINGKQTRTIVPNSCIDHAMINTRCDVDTPIGMIDPACLSACCIQRVHCISI